MHQRISVVVVAVGTADVKQKKEEKKTNHLFTRMDGCQCGQTNGGGSGHLRTRRGWMVVLANGRRSCGCKEKIERKFLLTCVGGSRRGWTSGDGGPVKAVSKD